MNQKPVFASWITLVIIAIFCASFCGKAQCQTVGDTFIDTSQWVQSSSPILTHGVHKGYITERIVRSDTDPNGRGYVQSVGGNVQSVIVEATNEYSPPSKIQPVVHESSQPSNASPPEMAIRPIPDPLLQVVSQPSLANANPAYQANLRGFVTPAGAQQALDNRGSIRRGMVPAGQAGFNAQASFFETAYSAATPYRAVPLPPTAYLQATSTSALTNCCGRLYTQTQSPPTQFVTPQLNGSPAALRTYPQYNGNPYPNPGYAMGQPYGGDTWVPMIPLRSMPYGTHLGQGIIGQPVAYVHGEVVRNFLRYVFP